MPTLTDFTDAQLKATGALKVKETSLYQLVEEGRAALKTGIWGARFGAVLPHDHGPHGGVLLGRHVLAWTLGPHFREGTSNPPVIGIPIAPPQVGVSMEATPKLLASVGCVIPGGVEQLFGRLGVRLPGGGSRTVTLIVAIRSLSKVGYEASRAPVSTSITITTSAVGIYHDASFTLDLNGLGDFTLDRWVEVCLWQASNPPAATTYRALFVILWPNTTTTRQLPAALGAALPQPDAREIMGGAFLVQQWLQRVRWIFDALIYGTLGLVPGKIWDRLDPDTPDRTAPWFKLIRAIHGHTGKSEADGAIIRQTLSALSCCVDFGDDGAGEVTADGVKGEKIDPGGGGTFGFNALTRFIQRVSIAKGCRALELRFALMPVHASPVGHLFCFARVVPVRNLDTFGSTGAIETNVTSGNGASVGLATRIIGFQGVEVTPLRGNAYQNPSAREALGYNGHWTADAQKPAAQMPPGILATNLYLVSDVVRIEITPPDTGDYMVEVRMALKDQAGDWVDSARLQWMTVLPAAGY